MVDSHKNAVARCRKWVPRRAGPAAELSYFPRTLNEMARAASFVWLSAQSGFVHKSDQTLKKTVLWPRNNPVHFYHSRRTLFLYTSSPLIFEMTFGRQQRQGDDISSSFSLWCNNQFYCNYWISFAQESALESVFNKRPFILIIDTNLNRY